MPSSGKSRTAAPLPSLCSPFPVIPCIHWICTVYTPRTWGTSTAAPHRSLPTPPKLTVPSVGRVLGSVAPWLPTWWHTLVANLEMAEMVPGGSDWLTELHRWLQGFGVHWVWGGGSAGVSPLCLLLPHPLLGVLSSCGGCAWSAPLLPTSRHSPQAVDQPFLCPHRGEQRELQSYVGAYMGTLSHPALRTHRDFCPSL